MRLARTAGVTGGIVIGTLVVVVAIALPLGQIGSGAPSASIVSARRSAPQTAAPTTTDPTHAQTVRPPSPTPVPEMGIDVGQLAPDFDPQTPEGETVRLSDFRGQPVWVNFWAPWCPACRTEMPRLEGFYLEHQDDGLVILGVGVRDSPDSMRTYAGEVGVTYPIVVDGAGAVANEYKALALPVHYWIDRDGIVRDWAFGELPPDLLASSLQSILIPPSAS